MSSVGEGHQRHGYASFYRRRRPHENLSKRDNIEPRVATVSQLLRPVWVVADDRQWVAWVDADRRHSQTFSGVAALPARQSSEPEGCPCKRAPPPRRFSFPNSMRWLRPHHARLLCHTQSFLRTLSTASERSPVVLRPYQESALDACTDALVAGASRIGVSLPTGSGKTTVFLTLLSRIAPPKDKPNATKSLVIVNAIELARQAAAQATHLFPHWTVEIEQGAKHKASGQADVYVVSSTMYYEI